MKKFNTCLLLILILWCGTISAQQNPTQSVIKSTLVQEFAEFVQSVSIFYQNGDSYLTFKKKVLLGSSSQQVQTVLPSLPHEGEKLLERAYWYLSKGLGSAEVYDNNDYQTFGEAVTFIHNYSQNTRSSIENAQIALFGGNESNLVNNALLPATKKKCKWWQLWCHIDEVFGEGVAAQIIQALITILFP